MMVSSLYRRLLLSLCIAGLHYALSIRETACSLQTCSACGIEDNQSRIAIGTRSDGIGALTLHIIGGLAYAYHIGVGFGGAIDTRSDFFTRASPHGVDRTRMLDFVFGDSRQVVGSTSSTDPQLRLLNLRDYPALVAKALTRNSRRDISLMHSSLEKLRSDVSKAKALYFLPCDSVEPPPPLYHVFMSEAFLRMLRQGSLCGVSAIFSEHSSYFPHEDADTRRVLTVALHIRRGDIESDEKLIKTRFVEDSRYFDVVEAIRRVVPSDVNLAVHGWMSCLSPMQCQHANETSAEYRERGITLHLDNEQHANATTQTLVAWSHFIEADIFVMSPSSFSQVPALLNRHCVIFTPRWRSRHKHVEQRYEALPNWINIGNEQQTGMQRKRKQSPGTNLEATIKAGLPRCLDTEFTFARSEPELEAQKPP